MGAQKAALAVSPDGTQLAAASATGGKVSVYDIAYSADGAVSLTEKYVITLGGNDMRALTWDVAGNLYASNSTNEYVKGVCIPRTNNDFTTKAASKYAVKYDMLMPVPKNCSMIEAAAIPEAFATAYENPFPKPA